jgi:hypothetical protein
MRFQLVITVVLQYAIPTTAVRNLGFTFRALANTWLMAARCAGLRRCLWGEPK